MGGKGKVLITEKAEEEEEEEEIVFLCFKISSPLGQLWKPRQLAS